MAAKATSVALGEKLTAYTHRKVESGEFRKAPSRRHLVFYFVTEDAIEVVRVLPARMDMLPQLEP